MTNMSVTTQLTSKRLKLNSLAAWSIILVGFLLILSGTGDTPDAHPVAWGSLISMYGLCHLTMTRIRIWWSHK